MQKLDRFKVKVYKNIKDKIIEGYWYYSVQVVDRDWIEAVCYGADIEVYSPSEMMNVIALPINDARIIPIM